MKCRKCGIEYSDKVCKIHETRCKVKKEEKKEIKVETKESEKTDWRKLAKDAGLTDEETDKFMKKSKANRQKQLDSLKGE